MSSTIRRRSGPRSCRRRARRWPRRGITAADIAAIGITNQRETTILWDSATGKPVANAIVWQSRVTAPICERLKADGHEPTFREQDRPGRRRLLLRHQDQAPARLVRRPARAGRARRDPVRHRRYVPDLAADRRQAARHRRQQRQPHAAVQHPHARVGRRAAGAARRAARDAARGALVERGVRRDAPGAVRQQRSPSRATPATSRRRRSARRASNRAPRRTPTAPAASCC